MGRISKAPEDRRHEIVQTALALFSEKGFEATTMQDIAEKMGVSQGLCYRYFKSKQEIFSATAAHYAEAYLADLDLPMGEGLSAVEQLNAVLLQIFAHELMHNEFQASCKKDPEIQLPQVVQSAEKTVDVILPIIRQGMAEQVFSCTDAENTARFLTFGLCFILHSPKIPRENPKEYILCCRSVIREQCMRVLGADEHAGIGAGWERLS